MKKINILRLSSLILGLGISTTTFYTLTSCQKEVKATSINFKDGDSLTLKVGDKHKFEVEVAPADTTSKVAFSFVDDGVTDPATIGTISQQGEFTASGVGTLTLKATVDGLEDTIVINVAPIEVESITINQGEGLEVEVGDTFKLTATVLPENATNKEVTWGIKKIEGYDDRYVTIDLEGNVTAESDGFVIITATCGTLTDEIKIHVMPTLTVAEQGDFAVTFDDETKEATLSTYKGTSTAVITPTEVVNPTNNETYKVTKIGNNCFKNSQTLERIKISEGVIAIGNTAFYSCTSLYTLHYPSTLKDIGYNCFYNCKSLEDGSLPEGIEYIGMNLYNSCSSLVKVTLPDSIKGCIDSKGKVEGKLQSLFVKCTSLETVKLPKNIKIIERMFPSCDNLKSFVLPEALERIQGSCFQSLPYLTELTIPDTVTYIGNMAISSNPNLTKINLPKALKTYNDNGTSTKDDDEGLDPNAIKGNEALKEITISEDNADFSTSEGILYNKDKSKLLCYPPMKEEKTYTAPTSLTGISENAFSGSHLESVDIHAVKSLDDGVFNGCNELTTVSWPTTILDIPASTFENCEKFTGFTFYDGITSIGDNAFKNTGITEAILPDSITKLGNYAICNNAKLKTLKLPDGLPSIGAYMINGNSAVTSLTLPSKLTSLASKSLSGYTSLKEITLPEGLKTVDYGCFYGDESLETINIPSSVTTFKVNSSSSRETDYMFYGCKRLTSITVGSENTKYKAVDGVLFELATKDPTYSYLAAYPANKTDSVYNVPEKTLTIYSQAFLGNAYLNKVSFNEELYTISSRAFKDTTALKEVLFNKFVTNPVLSRTYLSVSSDSFKGSTVRKIYYTGSYDDYNGGLLIKVSDATLKLIFQKYSTENPTNDFMHFNYEQKTF